MGQLQFQDESVTKRTTARASTSFARKLIAWGLVKTENQASMVLIFLIVAAGAVTIYNLLTLTKTPPPPTLHEEVTQ